MLIISGEDRQRRQPRHLRRREVGRGSLPVLGRERGLLEAVEAGAAEGERGARLRDGAARHEERLGRARLGH